ncbi:DALR anticodon-binding domain-containing protein [Streptomyces litchfieldiae]|uniref:DALR anticodon-binding domain-containing protein n=1 Tax=Streptomyces litchfieldiae TaxID=3075543 RepID=A0ABU2MJA2_9ACTN|nr:DALR anticodon-binding domain-containing protein [Streptomyces sp. DSM 44938]MDT0341443.1 DALR anticodon-binding domain-containing protein [Streptomyces sp. DSM 44938]
MTPAQLSQAVLRSARDLGLAGVPERAQLRPRGERGWGTGIALRLAGAAGVPAVEVARGLRERLADAVGVRDVEVDGRGFLTIRLGEEADAALLREILDRPRPAALPEDPARDAARWVAAAGGNDALAQRDENPLFRVRYAHARSRALLRGGRALGLTPEPGAAPFAHPRERALLAALGEQALGEEVWSVRRLVLIADAFLEVERARSALPVGDEKPGAAHRARLALAQAAGAVLAGGLHRLGISAPDHM